MINYVSLYHGVNDCLFIPYTFTKDYTNNYDKLVEEVEEFIVKHTVLTMYSSEKYIYYLYHMLFMLFLSFFINYLCLFIYVIYIVLIN